ncbi:MAG: hypothetical protein ABF651_00400 [Sporolactobacillus sp.]
MKAGFGAMLVPKIAMKKRLESGDVYRVDVKDKQLKLPIKLCTRKNEEPINWPLFSKREVQLKIFIKTIHFVSRHSSIVFNEEGFFIVLHYYVKYNFDEVISGC